MIRFTGFTLGLFQGIYNYCSHLRLAVVYFAFTLSLAICIDVALVSLWPSMPLWSAYWIACFTAVLSLTHLIAVLKRNPSRREGTFGYTKTQAWLRNNAIVVTVSIFLFAVLTVLGLIEIAANSPWLSASNLLTPKIDVGSINPLCSVAIGFNLALSIIDEITSTTVKRAGLSMEKYTALHAQTEHKTVNHKAVFLDAFEKTVQRKLLEAVPGARVDKKDSDEFHDRLRHKIIDIVGTEKKDFDQACTCTNTMTKNFGFITAALFFVVLVVSLLGTGAKITALELVLLGVASVAPLVCHISTIQSAETCFVNELKHFDRTAKVQTTQTDKEIAFVKILMPVYEELLLEAERDVLTLGTL
jgi:hypothetical protein